MFFPFLPLYKEINNIEDIVQSIKYIIIFLYPYLISGIIYLIAVANKKKIEAFVILFLKI